jgi:hypothetical protein
VVVKPAMVRLDSWEARNVALARRADQYRTNDAVDSISESGHTRRTKGFRSSIAFSSVAGTGRLNM